MPNEGMSAPGIVAAATQEQQHTFMDCFNKLLETEARLVRREVATQTVTDFNNDVKAVLVEISFPSTPVENWVSTDTDLRFWPDSQDGVGSKERCYSSGSLSEGQKRFDGTLDALTPSITSNGWRASNDLAAWTTGSKRLWR